MINKAEVFKQKLSSGDFSKISSFIEENFGILLPASKLRMTQTRLINRLIETEKPTFSEYVDYVFSGAGKTEVQNLVDEITTNRTEFFREIQHFDFIKENIIGKLDTVKVWSAGCASGEEPYSIAMQLMHNNTKFHIYASDLSTKALSEARKGIYSDRTVKPVPSDMISKYFTKDGNNYKVNNEIKKSVQYSHINLMNDTYNVPNDFDIIFFRNVSIYFSKENKDAVFTKMASHLKEGAYLILGVSENMFNKDLPFTKQRFSIFQKIS